MSNEIPIEPLTDVVGRHLRTSLMLAYVRGVGYEQFLSEPQRQQIEEEFASARATLKRISSGDPRKHVQEKVSALILAGDHVSQSNGMGTLYVNELAGYLSVAGSLVSSIPRLSR